MVQRMIYLLTAIGLSPGGSSTAHIYTQTIHRMTQNKQFIEQHNNLGNCGLCPVLASYTLAFALQLRKKHGKPQSVSLIFPMPSILKAGISRFVQENIRKSWVKDLEAGQDQRHLACERGPVTNQRLISSCLYNKHSAPSHLQT